METEILIKITLSVKEARVLRRLLGKMTGSQFAEYGVQGEDQKLMRELFNELCKISYEKE